MVFFIDTSALVKRYIDEPGYQFIRDVTEPNHVHTIAVSDITAVELYSALARRVREGNIAVGNMRLARKLIRKHVDTEYLVIALSPQIIELAGDLLEQHVLRAYDAIQLATALSVNARLVTAGEEPLSFLTTDRRLRNVAISAGLKSPEI